MNWNGVESGPTFDLTRRAFSWKGILIERLRLRLSRERCAYRAGAAGVSYSFSFLSRA